MNIRLNITALLTCTLGLIAFSSVAEAYTTLNGAAELSYISYNASRGGTPVYNGNSFTQNYSLFWKSSNLVQRNQPQFYTVQLGYDWRSFNTSVTDETSETRITGDLGKFLYDAQIGYSPVNLPIRFRAYMDNGFIPNFRNTIYSDIITDGFTYRIEGEGKGVSAGFTFAYEPERASSPSMRGLPRLYVDYRESINKSGGDLRYIDNMTKELAVAGLNKENNWLHYRALSYDNRINRSDNYDQQQIQIGLIDNIGRRKWSALTNWIDISADGRMTSRTGATKSNSFEEYDVNLFAIASRKAWDARTFLNFNRRLENDILTEKASIPIYLRGIWGAETEWYIRVSNSEGREISPVSKITRSQENSLAIGGTTFTRSQFTLAPLISIASSKNSNGSESLYINSSIESSSTRRFSDKLSLYALYNLRNLYIKDAFTTWSHSLLFRAGYRPVGQFAYEMKEELKYHNDSSKVSQAGPSSSSSTRNYFSSLTSGSVSWNKSAHLSSSLEANYDYLFSGETPSTLARLRHNITYRQEKTFLSYNMTLESRNSDNVKTNTLSTEGQLDYRPDRYHDSHLSYKYMNVNSSQIDVNNSSAELIQRYSYNFFTRTGVLRNYASISETLSLTKSNNLPASKFLMITGRYSPIGRLSLNGSLKIQDDAGNLTMIFSTGILAEFKLLSTSIDYAYARRDVDNKLEKRIAASVRRSF